MGASKRRKGIRKGKGGWIRWRDLGFVYENRTMKPVKIV
jgi:hypothetical protein